MKIRHLSTALVLAAGTMLTSSCIGSFGLFNTVLAWEKQATNSMIMNEIIFVLLSPVNAVCALADIVVVNSIEFWSGENPMMASVGKTRNIQGQDGRMYAVKTLKNGYEVTSDDGTKVCYLHDAKTDSWSYIQDGKKTEMLKYNGDGTIETFINGQSLRITPDEAGLMRLRLAADGNCWAMK